MRVWVRVRVRVRVRVCLLVAALVEHAGCAHALQVMLQHVRGDLVRVGVRGRG